MRWRDAERQFNETEPGSLDAVAEHACEDAQATYQALIEAQLLERAGGETEV